MATVRPGVFLEQNPPARSQWREGRRDPVKSVIEVHTAQSGTDRQGPDEKAEAVAGFISRRSSAGSYHLVGDADSIIQLVRFENEAFHDRTGSNRWSIAISLAMNAADWPTLTPTRRAELVDTAGQMAAIAAEWLIEQGLSVPAARLLTKAESDRPDASGFISHARRDPARRSDPGDHFPWDDFFAAYQRHLNGTSAGQKGTPVSDDLTKLSLSELTERLQRLALAHGADLGRWGADGDWGPTTARETLAAYQRWMERADFFERRLEDVQAALDATQAELTEARTTGPVNCGHDETLRRLATRLSTVGGVLENVREETSALEAIAKEASS